MTSQFAKCSLNDLIRFRRGDHRDVMSSLVIVNGRVVDVDRSVIVEADLVIDGAEIRSVGPDALTKVEGEPMVIDAGGALVAPGLIDLHGDAFERSLMPRGGVFADVDLALADNAAQLAASGISTAFLSATDSWEPGLRSRDTLRSLVDRLGCHQHGPEVLLHVRHETTNTEGFEELTGWVTSGAVAMISVADHTPGAITPTGARPSPLQLQRSGCSVEEFQSLTDAAIERRTAGAAQDHALCSVAQGAGRTTASHDGSSVDDVQRDIKRSVAMAEFPTSVEVAQAYRRAGLTVMFGAPNLVRGGSHLGNLSVRDALQPSAGDVVCSDYHYPSLLQSPFAAVAEGLCDLPTAWRTVSSAPAAAAGLTDRGSLEPQRRADVVIVDDASHPPRVRQLIVAGRVVYQAA